MQFKVWHYTVGKHYNNIVEDGYIRLATKYVSENEKPAVWFSSNTDWENSVRKTIQVEGREEYKDIARDELYKIGITPVRLEIDTNDLKLYNWQEFKKVSNMNPKIVNSFENEIARSWGYNTNDWYVSFEQIPLSRIKSVETWNGKEWQRLY